MGHPETPPEHDPNSFLEKPFLKGEYDPWVNEGAVVSDTDRMLRLQELAAHLLAPDDVMYLEELDEATDIDIKVATDYVIRRLNEFGYEEYPVVFERYGLLEQNGETE